MSVKKQIKWSVEELAAGGLAGGLSRFIIAPLDILKIRFQLQPLPISRHVVDARYQSIFQSYRNLIKEEGFKTLWRGNLAAELLWISYTAIQFAAFDRISRIVESDSIITKSLNNITCGAIAGTSATIATYPFDVMRTRFASQGIPKVYSSMPNMIAQIAKHEGFAGFYKGMGPTLVQIAPFIGIKFAMYGPLKRYSNSHLPTRFSAFDTILAGSIAGFAAKVVVYPLDTVKKRLQMQGIVRDSSYGVLPNYSGTMDCFKTVWRQEGLRGFFKGIQPSAVKAAVAAAVTFCAYEDIRKFIHEKNAGRRAWLK